MPSGLHALVVGVSEYPHHADLPLLPGAATSAARFAQWLETDYNHPARPLISTQVLLSPTEEEVDAVTQSLRAEWLPARRDEMETALKAWASDCDGDSENVALLYVAGHGCYTTFDGGFLLLEGAGRSDDLLAHALNVTDLVRAMATKQARVNYFFVDACRNTLEEQVDLDLGSGIRLAPDKNAPERREVHKVWYGAAPSTQSWTLPDELTTVFSKALREALERDAISVDDDGQICVLANSLADAVSNNVKRLARELTERHGRLIAQSSDPHGTLTDVVFHIPRELPMVDLEIELLPPEPNVLATAHADVFLQGQYLDQIRFDPNPCTLRGRAGKYSLHITSQPPPPAFQPTNPARLVLPTATYWQVVVGDE